MIVPCGITANLADAEKQKLYDSCEELSRSLKGSGIRSKVDLRDNYSPGWKFNHWELKVRVWERGVRVWERGVRVWEGDACVGGRGGPEGQLLPRVEVQPLGAQGACVGPRCA